MPKITPKDRGSGKMTKIHSSRQIQIARRFVDLHKNPSKKFGSDSLCTIYDNLITGKYGEVRNIGDGRLCVEIDEDEEKSGISTMCCFEGENNRATMPNIDTTTRPAKIPYFKLNERTGKYTTRRGITEAQLLKVASRVAVDQVKRGGPLTSPDATKAYLKGQLQAREREFFACLFLDNQNRVIQYEELFSGTIDGASVYSRVVVKRSLELNAAAVIFAHNHPSGITEPSQADRQITEKLKAALDLVDIRALDHFIIGDGSPYSFSEHGLTF